MARTRVLMRFGKHKFYVKPKEIRSFGGLKIKATLNTEDATVDGCKFTSKKGAGALEVTFTVYLDKRMGADPYKDAKALVDGALKGETGYLYTQDGKKPWAARLMMTDAEIGNIMMQPNSKWMYAEVIVTLKQCSKGDGNTQSADTGGGGDAGDGTRIYKVQIPGMSTVQVRAKSVQGAITKAVGTNWTGTIYVDGTAYYVVKGQIGTKPTESGSDTTTPTTTSDAAAEAAAASAETAAGAAAYVADLISNYFGGK